MCLPCCCWCIVQLVHWDAIIPGAISHCYLVHQYWQHHCFCTAFVVGCLEPGAFWQFTKVHANSIKILGTHVTTWIRTSEGMLKTRFFTSCGNIALMRNMKGVCVANAVWQMKHAAARGSLEYLLGLDSVIFNKLVDFFSCLVQFIT